MEQSTVNINTLRESGELDLGILVDGIVHRAFTVRPATLADTYRAAQSVAVPDSLTENQATRVAYQMAVDDAQVLCQLERLGGLATVPAPQALATELDPDDMAILRLAADSVKKKLRQSRQNLPLTGEPNTSSSVPVSP